MAAPAELVDGPVSVQSWAGPGHDTGPSVLFWRTGPLSYPEPLRHRQLASDPRLAGGRAFLVALVLGVIGSVLLMGLAELA